MKTAASSSAALCIALVMFPAASPAIEPAKLTGAIVGRVTDAAGVPQMGATVMLFNRFERLLDRVITNERGAFLFDSLLPETYSVRVNLQSFVPALKRNIAILPGARSFLAINLTSMFSSVELVYMTPGETPLMSEEWKWVLRSAGATRPILRIMPGIDISDPAFSRRRRAALFTDTRGLLRVSAGDGGSLSSVGSQADLGTAFALATSLFGSHELEFSGNLGYGSAAGIPTAGFRTSFSRDAARDGHGPEVNLTMRQIFLPARVGSALSTGSNTGTPALQSMALSFADRRQLGDFLEIEYGSSMESVSFLNRLNYISPFARVKVGTLETGAFEIAFSSGAPATELLSPGALSGTELQHQLSTLAIFPRVSLRRGEVQVQRTENFELGYRRSFGDNTFAAAAWRESVSNAAMTMAAPAGFYSGRELMPDLASIGSFRRTGYSAALSRKLSDSLTAGLTYGISGVLAAGAPNLFSNNPTELRNLLRRASRSSITMRLAGTAPGAGTRYIATYQFTDYDVLQPVHLSLTQRSTLDPGLNLSLRQPVPGLNGVFSGRLEATAELRNLLAQGYLPITTADGRSLYLIQSPRAIRGGLSFIF
ncbi:MAG: hypothetical protein FJW20_06585 [Acidimicrobiia bacterium]|nr:hypothetical protein [Acidimicrobiia bacterium]